MQIDPQNVQLVGLILGPLLSTGLGTYFGLKSGLNGLKGSASRAEQSLQSIRDTGREALQELREHRTESQRAVSELKQVVRDGP